MSVCLNCGHGNQFHPHADQAGRPCRHKHCICPGFRDEPTDRELANRVGVEGGIGYPLELGEHDGRL